MGSYKLTLSYFLKSGKYLICIRHLILEEASLTTTKLAMVMTLCYIIYSLLSSNNILLHTMASLLSYLEILFSDTQLTSKVYRMFNTL